ncbi:MAG: hypothetical protein OXG11_02680 [Chloroflexi bacterium]|nr:hypothetical protein [Chloroflexota bacterium]
MIDDLAGIRGRANRWKMWGVDFDVRRDVFAHWTRGRLTVVIARRSGQSSHI